MWWFALRWPPEDAPVASLQDAPAAPSTGDPLGWWALRYTPRVVRVDGVLLLEVSAGLRLWGGAAALQRRILEENPPLRPTDIAQAAIGIVAIAHLRLRREGHAIAAGGVAALPLHLLAAARAHLPLLSRLGLHTWGEADSLPRAAMVRRFGPQLRTALDIAFGREDEVYRWLTLPERFDEALELPAHAETAPALLWSANRLLAALQGWLRARQRGVLAFELVWTFDQKRLNGQELPSAQSLVVRTAEPAQQMEHLRRLLAGRLAHTTLHAPVVALRLVVRDSAPWQPGNASLLPGEQRRGEPLHVLVERASARLGPASVRRPVLRADHRPEVRQRWQVVEQGAPAASAGKRPGGAHDAGTPGPGCAPAPTFAQRGSDPMPADALAPAWLLRPPRPLQMRGDQPWHEGAALRLLTGPQRVETGWWPGQGDGVEPAARDYFIAQGASRQLLWVFRERATSRTSVDVPVRWFVQGVYA